MKKFVSPSWQLKGQGRQSGDELPLSLRRVLHRAFHYLPFAGHATGQAGWCSLHQSHGRFPLPGFWSSRAAELLWRPASFKRDVRQLARRSLALARQAGSRDSALISAPLGKPRPALLFRHVCLLPQTRVARSLPAAAPRHSTRLDLVSRGRQDAGH